MRRDFWLWWWDGNFLPEKFLGRELIWSVNNGGPVAWPGVIRCLFREHINDGYDNCVYCGAWKKYTRRRWDQ